MHPVRERSPAAAVALGVDVATSPDEVWLTGEFLARADIDVSDSETNRVDSGSFFRKFASWAAVRRAALYEPEHGGVRLPSRPRVATGSTVRVHPDNLPAASDGASSASEAELPTSVQIRPRRGPVNRLRRFPSGDRTSPEPQSARTSSARRCVCRTTRWRHRCIRYAVGAVDWLEQAESVTENGSDRRFPCVTRDQHCRASPGRPSRARAPSPECALKRLGERRAARAVPESR